MPVLFLAVLTTSIASAQQRVLGIDVSAWQQNISAANWATLKRPTDQQVSGVFGDGRDFAFIRSSRGGTTGYYNQNDPNNNNGLNTLSQRYDDPYFVQNITRATAAGLLAGSYHFARPDVIESTQNSGGIANTGTDEANHMLQMAGAWMRPGYLLPVLDLEAGQAQRTSAQLTTFSIEFADRIHEVMGIRPFVYINGNYANYVQSSIVASLPYLWTARWPNQADPDSIPVQTGHPKDSYTPIYGPWDDPPNPTHPWHFWQYASTARLNGYASGGANIDVNVAQGGMEFIKDYLVPALWTHNSNGVWTTLTNWNSGLTPLAPVQGTGQVARVGTLTLPAARLPTSNDTVILDRPDANITVTLSSGTHNIRKLYMRESLLITSGALAINYLPSPDSTPISAQFSGPVTLRNSGSLSLHTVEVDPAQIFTLGGGTLTFARINLMPHSSTPARIVVTNNMIFNALAGAPATIVRGVGSGNSPSIDLGGAGRNFAVGPADGELSIDVPIVNGAVAKSGFGTMRLSLPNSYAGGSTLLAGRLLANNAAGSATGAGSVTVNGGILGGTGIISGPVTINAGGTIMPGSASSIGRLTLHSVPTLNGVTTVRVNRNGSSPLADRLVLTAGTLNYGGTLVVSNVGASLIGGEVFTNFVAPAYSGAFASTVLPTLNGGLNWYTGSLAVNGALKVNRCPVAGQAAFTYDAPQVLQIPIASLIGNATDPDGDTIALSGVSLITSNGITLGTNSTFILYSNFVSVADHFNYTVTDGRGGSATGSVHITSSPRGRFTGLPNPNGSSVTLDFAGQPGRTYYIERSTNLPIWATVATNIAPASGIFAFTDPEPAPAVLYRLRWSP